MASSREVWAALRASSSSVLLATTSSSSDLEKKKKEEKEKASELEEAESALEEVEAEETVDLSVGNDESETESAEASVRSELVEFVSARLGNTSK